MLGDFAVDDPVFDFLVDHLGWPNVKRLRVEQTEIGEEIIISISGSNASEGRWLKLTCLRDEVQSMSHSEYSALLRAYRRQQVGIKLVCNNG